MTAERDGVGFIVGKALEFRAKANAPLSTILSSCDRLLERADLPPEARKGAQAARDAAEQLRGLLKELDLADSKTRTYVKRKKERGR